MNTAQPNSGIASAHFLLGVPEYSLPFRTDVAGPALSVGSPSYVRNTGQNSAKLLLALAEGFFIPLDFAEILESNDKCGAVQCLDQGMHPTFAGKAGP